MSILFFLTAHYYKLFYVNIVCMKNVALILASGTGSRFGSDCPKQFVSIYDKCILQYTLERFQENDKIDDIYIVTNKEYVDTVEKLSDKYSKVVKVVSGGKTRKDSSYNGISAIDYAECNVLIHDGVRPLVSDEIINNCIKELETKSAVCTVIDSTDTVYETDDDNRIVNIPKRKNIKRAQTPQCFKLSLIKEAHNLAKKDIGCEVTDDCGLIMMYGLSPIYTIKGSEQNIKITYPGDIEYAKKYLSKDMKFQQKT